MSLCIRAQKMRISTGKETQDNAILSSKNISEYWQATSQVIDCRSWRHCSDNTIHCGDIAQGKLCKCMNYEQEAEEAKERLNDSEQVG